MRRSVTIKEIAARLGVSHSTVSRALNDHHHTSDRTKARVRAAAETMGYIAHTPARTMRRARGSIVGLIVPDVQNDFYATVAKVMAESCAAESLQLVLALSEDDPDLEYRHALALREALAAGVVITASAAPRRATLALLRDSPTVQLVRDHPGVEGDWVGIDDHEGTFAAASHLIELGHKRLAFVGAPEELSTGAARLAGFRDALANGGLSAASAPVELGPPRPGFGVEAVARLLALRPRPTGLVTASSQLTIGALDAVRAAGLALPGDLSMVGLSDPDWFRLWGPGITTVGLPVHEIATTAASLLFRRIREQDVSQGGEELRPTRAQLSPYLIVRGTTAPPPARS